MVKLVVTFGFLIAFAAGLAVGMKSHPPVPPVASSSTTHPSGHDGSFLRTALSLTPEQQEKMKKIWPETPGLSFKDQRDRRDQCRTERDEAVQSLLTADQKEKYTDIQKTFRDKNDAIDREFRADFQKKVEETNKILTPEQQVKYQELLSRRQFDRGPRDRGDRGGFRESNRRGDDHATSQPRSQP